MSTFVQSVINQEVKSTQFFDQKIDGEKYMRGLIETIGKKTIASMARESKIEERELSNELDVITPEVAQKMLIERVKFLATKENPGAMIIDGTMIEKPYAQIMEKLTFDYNGNGKRKEKGHSLIVGAWTNGEATIPLIAEPWINTKMAGDQYVSKEDIIQKMLLDLKDKVPFNMVYLDGTFPSQTMLKFLEHNGFKFVIRMPKNRIVIINSVSAQLKKHSELQLQKNGKYKTAQGTYKEQPLFFTAHKRDGRRGKPETVFFVSNQVYEKPKNYIASYALRWNIEKFFRTAKQSLGLTDCQSTSFKRQRSHFYLIMLTYSQLEILKLFNKKKNAEELIRMLRFQKIPLSPLKKPAENLNFFEF